MYIKWKGRDSRNSDNKNIKKRAFILAISIFSNVASKEERRLNKFLAHNSIYTQLQIYCVKHNVEIVDYISIWSKPWSRSTFQHFLCVLFLQTKLVKRKVIFSHQGKSVFLVMPKAFPILRPVRIIMIKWRLNECFYFACNRY